MITNRFRVGAHYLGQGACRPAGECFKFKVEFKVDSRPWRVWRQRAELMEG